MWSVKIASGHVAGPRKDLNVLFLCHNTSFKANYTWNLRQNLFLVAEEAIGQTAAQTLTLSL